MEDSFRRHTLPEEHDRRDAAHAAVDAMYESVAAKQDTLKERRQRQEELYIKLQQERLNVMRSWEDLRSRELLLKDEERRLKEAIDSAWHLQSDNTSSSLPTAPLASDRVKLNIGGQIFETTTSVLTREPESVLARLVSKRPEADGAHFFDRDWWLFRHVLQYLREGESTLPRDRALLKNLYREAGYWRLVGMRDAIRNLYQRLGGAADTGGLDGSGVAMGDMMQDPENIAGYYPAHAPVHTHGDMGPYYYAAGAPPPPPPPPHHYPHSHGPPHTQYALPYGPQRYQGGYAEGMEGPGYDDINREYMGVPRQAPMTGYSAPYEE